MRNVGLSLLFLDTAATRRSMPNSLASDLNLDKLLSEDTLELLLTTISEAEVAARLEVFGMLENPEFENKMTVLRTALAELSQIENAFNNAACELEELMTMRLRCAAYLNVYSALESLGGGSALLDTLQSKISALSELRAELDSELAKTSDCTSELSQTVISLDSPGKLRLSHFNGDSITQRLIEKLRAYGCDRNPKKNEVRMTPALSEAAANLNNEAITKLRELKIRFIPQLDTDILSLKRELEFYLEIHALIKRGCKHGFQFCYPTTSAKKCYKAVNTCDFTLLVKDCAVVPNDIEFDADSSVCFLTGANGGGKTTYLRCTAANLLLALAGCPIFAERAEVYHFDYICAHFPADESFTQSGRLVEEANRVDTMLAQCSTDSFVFMNETYSGTDDIKGAEMTLETAEKLKSIGAFALWVTHFHEVADKGYTMLTTVIDETDSAHRTYRIVKRRGNGSSYAYDILKKYRLDAESLKSRRNMNA